MQGVSNSAKNTYSFEKFIHISLVNLVLAVGFLIERSPVDLVVKESHVLPC